jgi:hypothetical protein
MKRRPWDATDTYATGTLYTFLTAGHYSYVLDLHFTLLHIEFDKISTPSHPTTIPRHVLHDRLMVAFDVRHMM